MYDSNEDTYKINKNNKWYLQIQGELNITGRKVWILGVFTVFQFPLKVDYINKKRCVQQQNLTKVVQILSGLHATGVRCSTGK